MITLEQVEKLREKANVSYDEAKAAMEATGGDILEALILLERQGKVREPVGGGYYNSEKSARQEKNEANGTQKTGARGGESFSGLIKRLGRFLAELLRRGNRNTFELHRGDALQASFPITVLVLLAVCFFWVTIPLLIIGLFFNFRYRFVGPDLGKDSVNNAMDSAARVAEDIKNSMND